MREICRRDVHLSVSEDGIRSYFILPLPATYPATLKFYNDILFFVQIVKMLIK